MLVSILTGTGMQVLEVSAGTCPRAGQTSGQLAILRGSGVLSAR